MAIANLALRFALELFGVGAVAYWGFQTSIALGIAAALGLILVWAVVVAPKARNPLTQSKRSLIGTVLLVLAAFVLATAGHPAVALAFAGVVLLNQALLIHLGGDAAASLRFATDLDHGKRGPA